MIDVIRKRVIQTCLISNLWLKRYESLMGHGVLLN